MEGADGKDQRGIERGRQEREGGERRGMEGEGGLTIIPSPSIKTIIYGFRFYILSLAISPQKHPTPTAPPSFSFPACRSVHTLKPSQSIPICPTLVVAALSCTCKSLRLFLASSRSKFASSNSFRRTAFSPTRRRSTLSV